MQLALVPINPIVGDLKGNAVLIEQAARRAVERHADLVVFPELCLCGYPPRDLLEQEGFVERACDTACELAQRLPQSATIVLGGPWRPSKDEHAAPDAIDSRAQPTNSAIVIRGGRIIARYDKRLLPNYDVFDEMRHFSRGRSPLILDIAGKRVGLAICEDLWRAEDARRGGLYAGMRDPLDELFAHHVELLVVPSASPFVQHKGAAQEAILARIARERNVTLASVNQLGANDDLIFDGCASVHGPTGALLATNAPFSGEAVHAALGAEPLAMPRSAYESIDPMELLWQALVLGVRDYCRKSGFRQITLGLSGGIDSALTAVIAAAAIGGNNILGALMPSRFSSTGSEEDAEALGHAIGARLVTIPIEEAHRAFEHTLGPAFQSLGLPSEHGLTEENVQSRIRGTIMMGLSNKTGALLLTTGNKSELAMGYTTLYGDMNGGLAVIADLLKTEVYALARFVNEHHERLGFMAPPIPKPSITKAPSAELRPNQTDQDTLPPYDILDMVVERSVDLRQSVAHIALETGLDIAFVRDIVQRIDRSEYKRFQLAIGLKVRPSAFGRGRRRAIVERADHAR